MTLIVFAYLAGSINFPVLLFKTLDKGDPRDEFSKNPGAFNVYRQLGFRWALVILIIDVVRAIGVAFVAAISVETALIPWVGLGLIAGNRLPCFHQFKGGKGVANYLGFSILIAPLWSLGGVLVWLLTYIIFRIAFISSFFLVLILAAGSVLACNFDPLATAGTLFTVALIFYSHRSNLNEFILERKESMKIPGSR